MRGKKKEPWSWMSVNVDAMTITRLSRLAAESDRSKASLIRQAIREFLERAVARGQSAA